MVKVREVPPTVDSGQLLAGAQFVDQLATTTDALATNNYEEVKGIAHIDSDARNCYVNAAGALGGVPTGDDEKGEAAEHRRKLVNAPSVSAKQADGDAAEGAHAKAGHVEQADVSAADVGGRVELDQRLRHRVERQLEESGGEQ